MDDLNIPSLEEKLKEREKPITNGPTKLVNDETQKETQLKNNEQNKGGHASDETPVKNNTVQLGEGEEWNTPEQSNSEDSSLSDSERTLMGDVPDCEDRVQSNFPNLEEVHVYQPYNPNHIENWDIEDESDYYFKAIPHSEESQKCKYHSEPRNPFVNLFSGLIFIFLSISPVRFVSFFLLCLFSTQSIGG